MEPDLQIGTMTDLPQTRQSLLVELGKRSEHAWTEFLEVYEDALYRFCRRRGLQDADARDVLQDVLAAVNRKLPSWDHDSNRGSFRGWLFRVARNMTADVIARRANKEKATGDSLVAKLLSDQPETIQAKFEEDYQKSLFDWASQRVKSKVNDETWKAFYLAAIEGQSAQTVAAKLNISVGSVYTSKCRIVARIRNEVENLSGEFPDPT